MALVAGVAAATRFVAGVVAIVPLLSAAAAAGSTFGFCFSTVAATPLFSGIAAPFACIAMSRVAFSFAATAAAAMQQYS